MRKCIWNSHAHVGYELTSPNKLALSFNALNSEWNWYTFPDFVGEVLNLAERELSYTSVSLMHPTQKPLNSMQPISCCFDWGWFDTEISFKDPWMSHLEVETTTNQQRIRKGWISYVG